jgi:hypothetical protein
MQLIEPLGEIFDLVQMDFTGPLPRSTNGNRYVISLTDYLSKYVMCPWNLVLLINYRQIVVHISHPQSSEKLRRNLAVYIQYQRHIIRNLKV